MAEAEAPDRAGIRAGAGRVLVGLVAERLVSSSSSSTSGSVAVAVPVRRPRPPPGWRRSARSASRRARPPGGGAARFPKPGAAGARSAPARGRASARSGPPPTTAPAPFSISSSASSSAMQRAVCARTRSGLRPPAGRDWPAQASARRAAAAKPSVVSGRNGRMIASPLYVCSALALHREGISYATPFRWATLVQSIAEPGEALKRRWPCSTATGAFSSAGTASGRPSPWAVEQRGSPAQLRSTDQGMTARRSSFRFVCGEELHETTEHSAAGSGHRSSGCALQSESAGSSSCSSWVLPGPGGASWE